MNRINPDLSDLIDRVRRDLPDGRNLSRAQLASEIEGTDYDPALEDQFDEAGDDDHEDEDWPADDDTP